MMGDTLKEVTAGKGYDLLQIVLDNFGQDTPEEMVEYFLWNATAFPFADEAYMRQQIEQAAKDSGGDIQKAVDMAYEQLDAIMSEFSTMSE